MTPRFVFFFWFPLASSFFVYTRSRCTTSTKATIFPSHICKRKGSVLDVYRIFYTNQAEPNVLKDPKTRRILQKLNYF